MRLDLEPRIRLRHRAGRRVPPLPSAGCSHPVRGGRVPVSSTPSQQSGRGVRRQSNRLLRALAPPDYAMVVPQLTRVALGAGEILSKAYARPRHVYFPETAVLAL